LEAPEHVGLIQRVLAIPNQRQPRTLVGFLNRPEIDALLAAPNRNTWLGRRDHAILLLAAQTGLRLSEMTALRHEHIWLGTGPYVRCQGKGRKERCTPLAKSTVVVLKSWIQEQGREDSKTLFPSKRGGSLCADGFSTCSDGTWRRHERLAQRCGRNASPHMCFGIVRPWSSCRPAKIAR
jgi:integrase/recombinase XerD